ESHSSSSCVLELTLYCDRVSMSRRRTYSRPRVPHSGAVNQPPGTFRNAQVSYGRPFLIARGDDKLFKLRSIDAGRADAIPNAFASCFEVFNQVAIVNGSVGVAAIFGEAQIPQLAETFVAGFGIGCIQFRVPAFQILTPGMNAEAVERHVIL